MARIKKETEKDERLLRRLMLNNRNDPSKQLCFRLPADILDALYEYADEFNHSYSMFVRMAVYDFLHKRGRV